MPVTTSGTRVKAVDIGNMEEYEVTVTDTHNVPVITGSSSSINFVGKLRGDGGFNHA